MGNGLSQIIVLLSSLCGFIPICVQFHSLLGLAVIMSILRFHALSWSELICLRFPISYQSIDTCKNCLMSHRAEGDVGIRAESYSICQRTVAVAVSRIAGTMIIHLFGLCKFCAKFFFSVATSKGWIPCCHWDTERKKNSKFFWSSDFVLKKWTKSLVDVSDWYWCS